MPTAKPFVLALLPAGADADVLYREGVWAAGAAAGAYCERAELTDHAEDAVARLYNQIAKADLIVADLSGADPNVYYAAGYARALGGRAVSLIREGKRLPFDADHYPNVVYRPDDLAALRDALAARLRWSAEHPEENPASVSPDFDLYVQDEPLADGGRVVASQEHMGDDVYRFTLYLHNSTRQTVDLGRFRFSLVTAAYEGAAGDRERVVALPDGRRAVYWTFEGHVYPGDWRPLHFSLGGSGIRERPESAPRDAFRISSDLGGREVAVDFVPHSAVMSLLDGALHEAGRGAG